MDIDDGRPTLRVSELERAPPAAASTAVFQAGAGAGAGAGVGVGTAQVVSADHPGNEASEGVDAGAAVRDANFDIIRIRTTRYLHY